MSVMKALHSQIYADVLMVVLEPAAPRCSGTSCLICFPLKGKYKLSIACGERRLFPAVRAAPPQTLVIADGSNCQEQIAHATGCSALHLAHVLQLALHEGPTRQWSYPKRLYLNKRQTAVRQAMRTTALRLFGGAVTAVTLRRLLYRY
jgi:hypothetical protein